jgi:zinc transporter ZupT
LTYSPIIAVLVSALFAAISDLAGAILFLKSRFRSIQTRYAVGFASGILVSAAFLELIPQADVSTNALIVLLGFFTFYLVEKAIMLHSCGEAECEAHTVDWISIVGMASDNIVDGIGIAIGYATNLSLGLVVTLAVIAHEIPQGFTTAALATRSGFRVWRIIIFLLIAGAMYPIGAALASLIPANFYTMAIAFVAGDFIYIGAGDLLGEAHKKFNSRVVISVVLGGLIAVALNFLG